MSTTLSHLRTLFLVAGILLLLHGSSHGQAPTPENPTQYQTASDLPGIDYQLTIIKRITPTRLMIVVRLQASNQTPAGGVFLGLPAKIAGPPPPPAKRKGDLRDYYPTPFELATSMMKDELSNTNYPALTPVTPPGKAYFPSGTAGLLMPGQMRTLSLQFDIPPPPPPPAPGLKPPTQTLAFTFPKATKPITHVPLPPPLPDKSP